MERLRLHELVYVRRREVSPLCKQASPLHISVLQWQEQLCLTVAVSDCHSFAIQKFSSTYVPKKPWPGSVSGDGQSTVVTAAAGGSQFSLCGYVSVLRDHEAWKCFPPGWGKMAGTLYIYMQQCCSKVITLEERMLYPKDVSSCIQGHMEEILKPLPLFLAHSAECCRCSVTR